MMALLKLQIQYSSLLANIFEVQLDDIHEFRVLSKKINDNYCKSLDRIQPILLQVYMSYFHILYIYVYIHIHLHKYTSRGSQETGYVLILNCTHIISNGNTRYPRISCAQSFSLYTQGPLGMFYKPINEEGYFYLRSCS